MKKVAVSLILIFYLSFFAAPIEATLPPAIVKGDIQGLTVRFPLDEGMGNVSSDLTGTYFVYQNNSATGNVTHENWAVGLFGNCTYASNHGYGASSTNMLKITSIGNYSSITFYFKRRLSGCYYKVPFYQPNIFTLNFGRCNKYKVRVGFSYNGQEWGKCYPEDVKWHFIAIVFRGTNASFYFDGKKVGTIEGGPKPNATEDFYVGTYCPSACGLEILIDELRFYDRPLTDEEVQLLSQLPFNYTLSEANLQLLGEPVIDIGKDSTIKIRYKESVNSNSDEALLPIPNGAIVQKSFVLNRYENLSTEYYLTIDDNRYVNASEVTFDIPITTRVVVRKEIPQEIVVNKEKLEYERDIYIKNPSDINVLAVIKLNPNVLGFSSDVYLDGVRMNSMNDSLMSAVVLKPGENQMTLRAEIPLNKQEVEFKVSPEDFLKIDSFSNAKTLTKKFAEAAKEGKIETSALVVRISTVDLGDRSFIIPLDVREKDVIEARTLTGSKELLLVKEENGKARVVVPATCFEGSNTKTAEIKILYQKKSSFFDRFGLSSLSSLFDKIKSILHLGG